MSEPSAPDLPGPIAKRSSIAGLWGIALLSLVLNLVGITWGLPARWHPDEKADVAARMASGGGLDPGSFINPSLPLYVMAPAIFVQDRLARAGALRGSLSDPLLLGRLLSALAAAGAVFLLGLAVRRATPQLGLVPPFLLALTPGFVNLAHFATPEPWFLLGTAATLLLAVGHTERSDSGLGSVLLLGVVLGLTASTKYTAVALVIPALAAVLLRPREPESCGGPPGPGPALAADRLALLLAGAIVAACGIALVASQGERLASSLHLDDARLLPPESAARFVASLGRKALGGGLGLASIALASLHSRLRPHLLPFARREIVALGLAAAAGFLVGTPYAALEPLRFLSDLAYDDQTRFEYKGLTGDATSFGAYLGLASDALTPPLFVTALAGLALAALRACRGRRALLVVALGALAPYLLLATGGHRAMRFVAPMLPPLVWLAALALCSIASSLPRRAATGLVAGRAAIGAALVVRLFLVDSRILAEAFMTTYIPQGATVDLIANHVGYAPRIPPGLTLRIVPTLSREMAPPQRFEEAASRYATDGADWLILTASFYQRFLDHPEQAPERARFFEDLLAGRGGYEVVARFEQHGILHPPAEFLDPQIVLLRKRPPQP